MFRPSLSVIVATGLGVGFVPVAPGTAGSLAAAIVALPILAFAGTPWLAVAIVVVVAVGIPAADRAAREMGDSDPGAVVIDEVAGQWIALLPAAPDFLSFAVAFAAFRLFDIAKPGPVGWADRRLKGGIGIMADDLIAGAFAAAIVWAVRTALS